MTPSKWSRGHRLVVGNHLTHDPLPNSMTQVRLIQDHTTGLQLAIDTEMLPGIPDGCVKRNPSILAWRRVGFGVNVVPM